MLFFGEGGREVSFWGGGGRGGRRRGVARREGGLGGGCTQNTLSHAFLSCAQSVLWCCQVVMHYSLSMWLRMKVCAYSKTVHTSRNMSYVTPEWTNTFSLCTRTPSFPSARPPTFHSSEINPCHDPQQASTGFLADVRTSTAGGGRVVFFF